MSTTFTRHPCSFCPVSLLQNCVKNNWHCKIDLSCYPKWSLSFQSSRCTRCGPFPYKPSRPNYGLVYSVLFLFLVDLKYLYPPILSVVFPLNWWIHDPRLIQCYLENISTTKASNGSDICLSYMWHRLSTCYPLSTVFVDDFQLLS